MDLAALGKLVIVCGLVLAAVGGLLLLLAKGIMPSLPGDLVFRLGNVRVFLPIATSIVLSVVLTLILNLVMRR